MLLRLGALAVRRAPLEDLLRRRRRRKFVLLGNLTNKNDDDVN
jgi:hypothetical protein